MHVNITSLHLSCSGNPTLFILGLLGVVLVHNCQFGLLIYQIWSKMRRIEGYTSATSQDDKRRVREHVISNVFLFCAFIGVIRAGMYYLFARITLFGGGCVVSIASPPTKWGLRRMVASGDWHR